MRACLDGYETDVLHANYWLSGVAGHRLKHELGLPLVSTFHTLARVKAETGDPEPQRRVEAEAEVAACSDVDHPPTPGSSPASSRSSMAPIRPASISCLRAWITPSSRPGPGAEPGLRSVWVLGRFCCSSVVSEPLKGLDVAVGTLARLVESGHPDARLLVVGGASGREGERELRRITGKVRQLGLADRIDFVPPRPHHLLSTYYRAADVCLVPSRSESFGLVALESAACGTPVVAADVGGLRTLVDHGRTGYLVGSRHPGDYAVLVDRILTDPDHADALSRNGVRDVQSIHLGRPPPLASSGSTAISGPVGSWTAWPEA